MSASTLPVSVPAPLPASPQVDYAAFGPVETRPVSRLQALTAAVLSRNWSTVPHVTHHADHRVINGADAARFLRHLDEVLAVPAALL